MKLNLLAELEEAIEVPHEVVGQSVDASLGSAAFDESNHFLTGLLVEVIVIVEPRWWETAYSMSLIMSCTSSMPISSCPTLSKNSSTEV